MEQRKLTRILFIIAYITLAFPVIVSASTTDDKNAKILMTEGDKYLYDYIPFYSKALDKYLEAYKMIGPKKNAELEYHIGVCYISTVNRLKSIPHLEAAYELNPTISSEILFLLATAYQLNMDFDNAYKYYSKYKSTLKEKELEKGKVAKVVANLYRDVKVRQLDQYDDVIIEGLGKTILKRMAECREAKKLIDNPVDVKIVNIGANVNSPYPDYAPVISADESVMYFTSRRPGSTGGQTDLFEGKFYEDVYVSLRIGDLWLKPENIGSPINDPVHNSAIGLSADGQNMFLYHVDEKNGGDIYESHLDGDKWTKPTALQKGINTEYYELSATLSADRRTLYFVSDRPIGIGGTDIYRCNRLPGDIWSEPENLGRTINTEFDEDGVFFHPNGKTLYFSSKGHKGMGGYDIYKTELDERGRFSRPENLGYPINTPDNDIYFVLGASGEKGYYSSVRTDGEGETDIYAIEFPVEKKEEKLTLLTGIVVDADTKEPLEATIIMEDIGKNEVVGEIVSNKKTGKYLIALPFGRNYGISVNKEGYLFHSENFNIPASETFQKVEKNIELKKLKAGSKIVLNNVFFDFNKATLDSTSEAELERLYDLMNDNPKLKVELSGHTDNKGSREYNQKLSEQRAQSVVDYLLNKGIDKKRLVAKGYGPDKPVAPNTNEDGSDNELGRAQNRRTEFEILEN